MPKYNDYPIAECAKEADKIIAMGGKVYQKFTCEACGQRLTVDTPNVFYLTGSCDQCGHITDLTVKGCNYLIVAPGNRLFDILKR